MHVWTRKAVLVKGVCVVCSFPRKLVVAQWKCESNESLSPWDKKAPRTSLIRGLEGAKSQHLTIVEVFPGLKSTLTGLLKVLLKVYNRNSTLYGSNPPAETKKSFFSGTYIAKGSKIKTKRDNSRF